MTTTKDIQSTGREALIQLAGTVLLAGISFALIKPHLPFGISLDLSWVIAIATLLGYIWIHISRMDGRATKDHAAREDAGRGITDILLITASVASLGALGFLLLHASKAPDNERMLDIGAGLAGIVVSWALVHTLYTLKYARAYYAAPQGGVEFNVSTLPRYVDFAYLAFTVGMTYQVSDTTIADNGIRAMILRQSLLSYLFGTAIIAGTINVIVSLSSNN